MNFNYVTIVSIKVNDYRIYFWYMIKNDVIVLMTNSNLKNKMEFYKNFHHIKDECNNLLSKKERSDFKQSKRLL